MTNVKLTNSSQPFFSAKTRKEILSCLEKETARYTLDSEKAQTAIDMAEQELGITIVNKKPIKTLEQLSDFQLFWLFISQPERFNSFFGLDFEKFFKKLTNESETKWICNKNIFTDIFEATNFSEFKPKPDITSEKDIFISSFEKNVPISIKCISKLSEEPSFALTPRQESCLKAELRKTKQPVLGL